MADEPLDDTIRENAKAPAKVTTDAGTVEQQPLRDQIEADRYLACASRNSFRREPGNRPSDDRSSSSAPSIPCCAGSNAR